MCALARNDSFAFPLCKLTKQFLSETALFSYDCIDKKESLHGIFGQKKRGLFGGNAKFSNKFELFIDSLLQKKYLYATISTVCAQLWYIHKNAIHNRKKQDIFPKMRKDG